MVVTQCCPKIGGKPGGEAKAFRKGMAIWESPSRPGTPDPWLFVCVVGREGRDDFEGCCRAPRSWLEPKALLEE